PEKASDSLGFCKINERKLLGWWWAGKHQTASSALTELLKSWLAGGDEEISGNPSLRRELHTCQEEGKTPSEEAESPLALG
ncbi:hypothetical protein KUCAC02_018464, partial [Chaenocephalus aceratus]